jgi:histidinol-phosphate/aromatic aminotransferase/cobyric acid decarboxylase-like protein
MTQLPPAGPHGGDGARIARALGIDVNEVLDLSQSLNPVAIDPRPVIAAHLDALSRYPDPEDARQSLATKMGVDASRLLLTNGGAEAIALIAAQMGGSVQEPEFSLHPRGIGPMWRSNPHSPSGLLAAASETAAVWDEAFYPLATGEWTRGDREAIVVGSLTKLLACPGLRIGYVLADPPFIEILKHRQPMWALNGLAAAALPDLLAQLNLLQDVAAVQRLRQELRTMLESHGLIVRPSDANWVLVQHATLRELLAPYAIVVRDCASFALPDVTRIAVPDEQGLARLGEALEHLGSQRLVSLDPDYSRGTVPAT